MVAQLINQLVALNFNDKWLIFWIIFQVEMQKIYFFLHVFAAFLSYYDSQKTSMDTLWT